MQEERPSRKNSVGGERRKTGLLAQQMQCGGRQGKTSMGWRKSLDGAGKDRAQGGNHRFLDWVKQDKD